MACIRPTQWLPPLKLSVREMETVWGPVCVAERTGVVCHGACLIVFFTRGVSYICMNLGMSLPYSSSSPADSQEKIEECLSAGAAMKYLLEKDLKPRDIMTKSAFENAIRMVMMTGGSTNAVLHLIAMSRSCQDPNVAISLNDFQRISNIVSCCSFALVVYDCRGVCVYYWFNPVANEQTSCNQS